MPAITFPSTIIFFFTLLISCPISARADEPQKNGNQTHKPVLIESAMCEGIKGLSPLNPSIVFSMEIGKVSCFTSFDPVPKETSIYQKWYHRDVLSKTQRLVLKPPRWATFSSIQLREADKGPWRVEITDHADHILHILRFSIVD